MSCGGVGHRYGSNPTLLWLWLWCRVALIRPLAWEVPYATGVALKKQNKTKKSQPPTIYIITKKFEILQELLKCDTETQREQMLLEKMVPTAPKMVIDLLEAGLPQTFTL